MVSAAALLRTVVVLAAAAGGLTWRNGAQMPIPSGGHAAALVGDRILVAGGTTWKNKRKRWLHEVWTYDPKVDRWAEAVSLPQPIGGGVGVSARDSLYLLGGSDGKRASAKCYRLQLRRVKVQAAPLPDLPEARVYAAGDCVGQQLFVVGGCTDGDRLGTAKATLFALDLDHPAKGWQVLPPLPGKPRICHAAAACVGALYVFGGCCLDAKGVLMNLADAYRYLPAARRWERLPDMPHANRGLTAIGDGARGIGLFGGYTASEEECKGKGDDFGFTDAVLRYDTRARAHRTLGKLPRATCDAAPVRLGHRLFLIGGEHIKRQRGAWVWGTRLWKR